MDVHPISPLPTITAAASAPANPCLGTTSASRASIETWIETTQAAQATIFTNSTTNPRKRKRRQSSTASDTSQASVTDQQARRELTDHLGYLGAAGMDSTPDDALAFQVDLPLSCYSLAPADRSTAGSHALGDCLRKQPSLYTEN